MFQAGDNVLIIGPDYLGNTSYIGSGGVIYANLVDAAKRKGLAIDVTGDGCCIFNDLPGPIKQELMRQLNDLWCVEYSEGDEAGNVFPTSSLMKINPLDDERVEDSVLEKAA